MDRIVYSFDHSVSWGDEGLRQLYDTHWRTMHPAVSEDRRTQEELAECGL